jgi:hypothetical protein
MWQIASTIGIALKNKVGYSFPRWNYQSNFINPLPDLVDNDYIDWAFYDPEYIDIVWTNENTHWNMKGYFQSYKYFDEFRNSILYYFRPVMEFPEVDSNAVAVHVRRGDYLKLPDIHPVLPLSYYYNCFTQFRSATPMYIFSDDIEWCKENFPKRFPNWGYCFVAPSNDITDLLYMSQFKNFIISNSSYSWWAAYLSKSENVFAPDIWTKIEDRKIINDRIPEYWQIVRTGL